VTRTKIIVGITDFWDLNLNYFDKNYMKFEYQKTVKTGFRPETKIY
jgi:hypothetical protein